jgi:hypothetical protein
MLCSIQLRRHDRGSHKALTLAGLENWKKGRRQAETGRNRQESAPLCDDNLGVVPLEYIRARVRSHRYRCYYLSANLSTQSGANSCPFYASRSNLHCHCQHPDILGSTSSPFSHTATREIGLSLETNSLRTDISSHFGTGTVCVRSSNVLF